jgi:hypothetical protein
MTSKPGQTKKLTPDSEKELIKEYLNGKSSPTLSKKYGISCSVVLDYLKRNKIKRRSISEASRKYAFNEKILDNLESPDVLWFLGWLWSDGCNKKIRMQITAHQNDEEVLHKLNKILSSNRPLEKPKNKKCRVLYIDSIDFCRKLQDLGCVPRKSLEINYPTWIKNKDGHKHFLRGVFEGDGCISFRRDNYLSAYCSIASGSKDFLLSVTKIIEDELNITTKINERKNSNSKRLYISGGIENVKKFMNYIYSDSEPHNRLDRKYSKHKLLC